MYTLEGNYQDNKGTLMQHKMASEEAHFRSIIEQIQRRFYKKLVAVVGTRQYRL